MKKVALLFFLSLSSASFCSQSSFSGQAFDEKGEHIFTEEYVVTKVDEKIKDVTTKFFSPEGALIAEMTSIFEEKSFLPKVTFKKDKLPFSYGCSFIEQSIELFKSTKKKPHSSKTLSMTNNMVVGHGFYTYILSKLEPLLSGREEKMVFLQPNKLASYTFSMTAHTIEADKDLVEVTLSIDNKLLKAFVPDIKLSIHKPSHQILSYEGISGFLPDFSSKKKISIKYSAPKEI